MDIYAVATLVNIIIGLAYVAVTAVLIPGLSLPASTSRSFGLALKALMVTFFLGCGFHHIHLAFHASFHGGGHSQITPEALAFNVMQVIAAPGAVAMAYYVRVAANRASSDVNDRMDRLEEKQDRVSEKQDKDLAISERTEKGVERMEKRMDEDA